MICPCMVTATGYVYRLHVPGCQLEVTPRHAPASGAQRRYDHESLMDWVLRWLEYREKQEPLDEMERRTR